ncbi:MAG: hypothetical protein MJ178_06940, partial [Treponemataceae bacterium]|nr:hypothetical protein [Treponemataceae bacterium]
MDRKLVSDLEDRVEAQMILADKIGIREDAMRKVCGTIALLTLIIEILFFAGSLFGAVGVLGLRFGW